MWQEGALQPDDGLRQGDLLARVHLPRHKLPLDHLTFPGATAQATLAELVSYPLVMVVSQCCTVENWGRVALSPVTSTPPLSPDESIPYRAVSPEEDAVHGYVFNAFLLEFHSDLINEEPVNMRGEEKSKLPIADLTRLAAFEGNMAELQSSRVARMTPEGRRELRIKLAHFWGRPTEEDQVALRRS